MPDEHFEPTFVLTPELLGPHVAAYLGAEAIQIADVDVKPVSLGTSAARHFNVAISTNLSPDPIRALLKVNRRNNPAEALFYRDLAGRIPLATPRLIALDAGAGN